MIPDVLTRVAAVYGSAAFDANLGTVSAALGIPTLFPPAPENVYTYPIDDVPQFPAAFAIYDSTVITYAKALKCVWTHTILTGMIVKLLSPRDIELARQGYIAALVPELTKSVRNGGNIFQSVVTKVNAVDFQNADSTMFVASFNLNLEVSEYMNSESL